MLSQGLREKNPWITFYGLWSTLRLLQWMMIKRLRIPLNCRCISMDLLSHRDEWFSLNHERQEPILTNWTWKPPPRDQGATGSLPVLFAFIICVLVGEIRKGRRFLIKKNFSVKSLMYWGHQKYGHLFNYCSRSPPGLRTFWKSEKKWKYNLWKTG